MKSLAKVFGAVQNFIGAFARLLSHLYSIRFVNFRVGFPERDMGID
jgi:hypothetical protein